MAELLQNEWRTQLITGGCAGKNNSTEAVSYTHLRKKIKEAAYELISSD